MEKRKRGRPPTGVKGRKVTVYLDDATIRRAELLGGGSASLGIRRALKAYEASSQDIFN